MHVPAGLEGRDHLLRDRDLGAIARISPGARVAPLDPEHAKALTAVSREKPLWSKEKLNPELLLAPEGASAPNFVRLEARLNRG